jgi:hypothetical protein
MIAIEFAPEDLEQLIEAIDNSLGVEDSVDMSLYEIKSKIELALLSHRFSRPVSEVKEVSFYE